MGKGGGKGKEGGGRERERMGKDGNGGRYGTRQKECNKCAAATLENMAPCVPLFSHRVHRNLMAAP